MSYAANAVKFDGKNDYLTRGGDLSGIADSKSGILSCWLRVDSADAHIVLLRSVESAMHFSALFNASTGKITIAGYNAAGGTAVVVMTTAKTYAASARWLHVLAAWDLAAGATHLYINDVADKTTTYATNDTIDYATASPNWAVGAFTDGTNKASACLSDLYFAPGHYLDFSVAENRRKIIDSSGGPVSLGADGSTPTGAAPVVFLSGGKTSFGTNTGNGGNFTVSGALEAASLPPSAPSVDAVKFNGTSDYLSRASDLSGLVDGKSGLLSCWVRLDASSANMRILANYNGSTQRFILTYITATGQFSLGAYNAAGAVILNLKTATARAASPKWLHLLFAWDLAAAAGSVYVDGVSDLAASPVLTNDTIDYALTTPSWGIGADASGGLYLNGALSELFFAPNQYLDMSVPANREKFIKAGIPVSLGGDGSTPTGTAPSLYLLNRAALVGGNAGSGGDFTINGTPKDASSTPLYYYAEPVKFDGSTSYFLRSADLTGIADGKSGIFSAWVRLDGGDGSFMALLRNLEATLRLSIIRRSTNTFQVYALNASGSAILNMETAAAYLASSTWVHVLAAWDLATGATHLYINNASDKVVTTATNDTIDYATASPNWAVGAGTAGGFKLNGAMAEIFFAQKQYHDFSIASNRAKFIDPSTLRPVSLGAKGEVPTGAQPLLYLARDYANWGKNLGSGGDFT